MNNNNEQNNFNENVNNQFNNQEIQHYHSIEQENSNLEKTKKQSSLKTFFLVLLAFFVGAVSVFGVQSFANYTRTVATSRVAVSEKELENQEITIAAVSKAKDAVVSIINYQQTTTSKSISDILGGNAEKNGLKAVSNGSGVIYKKEGNFAYIVTNNHVVTGAQKIGVVLSDGTNIDAEVIGSDIWTDLSVLKVSSDKINVVMDFANSDEVAVGETALAIGSPLNISLSNTVTKGIVSATERQIPIDIDKDSNYDWYQTVIQTDAAINPGNSGGALINNKGELIGINELKITSAGQETTAEGIGFVIPSNEVKIITEQLEKTGKVTRPALGVQLEAISALNSELVEGTLKYDPNRKGVVLKEVVENGAAAKAGLKQYDVITKFDNTKIEDAADLRKYLFENTKIGDKVVVTYFRDGKEQTTELTLGTLDN